MDVDCGAQLSRSAMLLIVPAAADKTPNAWLVHSSYAMLAGLQCCDLPLVCKSENTPTPKVPSNMLQSTPPPASPPPHTHTVNVWPTLTAIAATAAAAVATTTTATIATATAAAAAARWLGLVDTDGAALELSLIEVLDGLFVPVGHGHEAKAARPASLTVGGDEGILQAAQGRQKQAG